MNIHQCILLDILHQLLKSVVGGIHYAPMVEKHCWSKVQGGMRQGG